MNLQLVKKYIVNNRTMALVPVFQGEAQTMVYEAGKRVLLTKQSPLHVMRASCLERGSSLEGRRESVKYRLGIKQKTPVPVDQHEGIYGFPLRSPRNPNNIWLFYNHMYRAKVQSRGRESTIYFYDGQKLDTFTSSYTIKQQLLKTGSCKSIFQDKWFGPDQFPS